MYLVLEASGAFSRANYRHAYRDRSRLRATRRDRMLVAPSTEQQWSAARSSLDSGLSVAVR